MQDSTFCLLFSLNQIEEFRDMQPYFIQRGGVDGKYTSNAQSFQKNILLANSGDPCLTSYFKAFNMDLHYFQCLIKRTQDLYVLLIYPVCTDSFAIYVLHRKDNY